MRCSVIFFLYCFYHASDDVFYYMKYVNSWFAFYLCFIFGDNVNNSIYVRNYEFIDEYINI